MAKNTSTQIREFVKNALKSYYDNFQVKLPDIAKKDDINPVIKLNNDGSVYIYDLGNYDGTNIQNASSLQSIIKNSNIATIVPGTNINTQKEDQTLTISALGYTYNSEKNSYSEGNNSSAGGDNSHAEGENTTATGYASHVEGLSSQATNTASHAEGENTTASGSGAHAEGENTTASGHESHAEGNGTTASGSGAHAEGNTTKALGRYSHAEGSDTTTLGHESHAEGAVTTASGRASHAEGYKTHASGRGSHAEGQGLASDEIVPFVCSVIGTEEQNAIKAAFRITFVYCDHDDNIPDEYGSQGYIYNDADCTQLVSKITICHYYSASGYSGDYFNIKEGDSLTNGSTYYWKRICGASENYSHTEGNETAAFGQFSHAEGTITIASGESSHAEGDSTIASGYASHTEGNSTIASEVASHAEGTSTTASGESSHAEGDSTIASGGMSHAEGCMTIAAGSYSHTEGWCTKALNDIEHAEGIYNQSHEGKTIHSIGIGENEQTRKNAFEVMQDGSIYVYGLNYDGSTLANASTLQDICNSKANKIINATADNFVSLDANGNLQDSGKKQSDFSPRAHEHTEIIRTEGGIFKASIEARSSDSEGGMIRIALGGQGRTEEAWIKRSDLVNLSRALRSPSTPAPEGNNLITNGQAYTALQGKADKVAEAVEGNLAGLDENGNLTDSGYKPADFAVTDHKHNYIQSNASFSDGYGLVNVSGIQNLGGRITIGVTKLGLSKSAIIEYRNIENLNRALLDPEAPSQGSDKLSTSGQIYTAISKIIAHELELQYSYPVTNKWNLLNVLDNITFFNNLQYNTPVPVKFKCLRQADEQVSGIASHEFYVYGSIQTNQEEHNDIVIYVYVNNTVYSGILAEDPHEDERWVYNDNVALTKLAEDPFF